MAGASQVVPSTEEGDLLPFCMPSLAAEEILEGVRRWLKAEQGVWDLIVLYLGALLRSKLGGFVFRNDWKLVDPSLHFLHWDHLRSY